jgi:MSHA biogenesis protein MshO
MAIEFVMRQMRCPDQTARRAAGVTLIEMVIVITITAIIAGGVAVFISRPFESYIDAARRAELTDIADTALRRMTRDVRTALPNSIRITCVPAGCASTTDVYYLEYIQTSGGGRYRAELDSAGNGNPLDFTTTDSSFDVVGAPVTLAAGNSIVIYNLASSGTIANAYNVGDNRAATSSTGAVSTITLSPAFKFPYPAPGKRFHVAEYAVTYECNPTTGVLRRYWSYGIPVSQATPPTSPTPLTALLATAVTNCSFTFTSTGSRTGVLGVAIRVARSGEGVQLFQQVHLDNAP